MFVEHLDVRQSDFEKRLEAFLSSAGETPSELVSQVREVLADVRLHGDTALLRYAQKYDAYSGDDASLFRVSKDKIFNSMNELDGRIKGALDKSAERIRRYAEAQKLTSWEIEDDDGNRVGQRVQPIESVGLYVPGGTASYPSSLLMAGLPAQVAGVPRVVVVTPTQDGIGFSLLLAAAAICGIEEIYRVGGAHAIAALAFGTESIPKVDKIVGPGNQYVTEAKRQLFGQVGIDMLAGPSEVVVICDGSADPQWVAADLCSQAEHDEDARAVLLTTDPEMPGRVLAAMQTLIAEMPRAKIIKKALQNCGLMVTLTHLKEAAEIANRIAPEHLEIQVDDPHSILGLIHKAGAVFIGKYSPVVVGDYCAGPNHVLPTSGTARFASPLGVYDFQKRSSTIQCSRAGSGLLSRCASTMASQEGLYAHAKSADCRALNSVPVND